MSIAEKLRLRGLRPRKALGQNFLHDQRVCSAIAQATLPSPGAWVLEIGPGLGALTVPLLALAERVVALEKDTGLAAVLREEQAEAIASGRLVLHEGDATRLDWLPLLEGAPGERVIAGNLPYSVTGLLLERATTVAPHVARAVFMLQLEVAERLAAAPASEAYGALTVFVQAAFEVKGQPRPRPSRSRSTSASHRSRHRRWTPPTASSAAWSSSPRHGRPDHDARRQRSASAASSTSSASRSTRAAPSTPSARRSTASRPDLRRSVDEGRDLRDGHQGHRPARPVPKGRQDRPLRRRRRRQDRSHPRAHQQRRQGARRRVVFAGVGERTREGNDLFLEMSESKLDTGAPVISKTGLIYGQMNEPPGARARVALSASRSPSTSATKKARTCSSSSTTSSASRRPAPRCPRSSAASRAPSVTSRRSPPRWASSRSASPRRTRARSPACRPSTCPPTISPTRRPATAFAHLDATTCSRAPSPSSASTPPWTRSTRRRRMLDPQIVGERHYKVARKVQQTLQKYKDLQDIIAILGMDELSEDDKKIVGRAPARSRSSCRSPSSSPRSSPAARASS
jgi:precorrin-6B methylase 2